MTWRIIFSSRAEKTILTLGLDREKVVGIIVKTIKLFSGQKINIDVKKLKGGWYGFHRIRKGDLRIIAEFSFDDKKVLVEAIDWRGKIY